MLFLPLSLISVHGGKLFREGTPVALILKLDDNDRGVVPEIVHEEIYALTPMDFHPATHFLHGSIAIIAW